MNTYKKLLRCISADYGIIDHMMRIPGMSGDPRLVGYGVQSVNMRAMIGGDYTPLGAGCGLKREEAFKASVGETVERYCSAFVNSEECVSGAYSSLNGRYRLVMPSEFSLFHEKQFKDDFFSSVIHPFSSEVELTWTKVYSLTKGSYQYLPAQCVYLPFLRDRKLITMGVSTGLSAHSSFYQAILNGLYRQGRVWRFHSGRSSYAIDVCERIKKDSARDWAIYAKFSLFACAAQGERSGLR